MTNPLWGHMLKVQRASEHVGTFQDRVLRFLQGEAYVIAFQFDTDAGEEVVYATPQPGGEMFKLGIVVADVIHNLRSSLDNLVWALTQNNAHRVLPTGRRDPWRDVSFPVTKNPDQWPETVSRKLWGVRPELVDDFKSFQPWQDGQPPAARERLPVLEKLWNVDKHRSIPLLASDVQVEGVGRLPDEYRIKKTWQRTEPLVEQAEIARFSFDTSAVDPPELAEQMDTRLRFIVKIALDYRESEFAEFPLMARSPLMGELSALMDHVTQILIHFEDKFV